MTKTPEGETYEKRAVGLPRVKRTRIRVAVYYPSYPSKTVTTEPDRQDARAVNYDEAKTNEFTVARLRNNLRGQFVCCACVRS